MIQRYFLFLSFIGLGLTACVQPPEYPVEPVIEFVSLSKDVLVQSSSPIDETYLTISFTDGDGDLGYFEEGSTNVETDLFLKDLRTGADAVSFTIPFVPELGASNGISGEITVRLLTTCCVYPEDDPSAPPPCTPYAGYPIDTLVYEVYIVDRAGNESNRIETAPIYLLCDEQ